MHPITGGLTSRSPGDYLICAEYFLLEIKNTVRFQNFRILAVTLP